MHLRFPRSVFSPSSRLAAAIFLSLCLGAAGAAAQGGLPGYVVLPLVLRDRSNQAMLRVQVNGRSTLLMVDTGAPFTLLDSAFYRDTLPKGGVAKQEELPPELRRKTAANGQKAEFAVVGSLKAGGADFGKRPVVLTDLSANLGRYNNYHAVGAISGLLGEDILHQYAAIIDWRRRGVYFNVDKTRRLKLGPALEAAGWTPVPMAATSGNHFSVQATVEGKPVRAIVDTGATYTTFAPNVVKFSQMIYHLNDSAGSRLQTTAMPMSMINASTTAFPARLEHWKIGNYEVPTTVVSVTELPDGLLQERSAGEGPMLGLIGAEVLSLNNAIVDISGSTLYLKASRH